MRDPSKIVLLYFNLSCDITCIIPNCRFSLVLRCVCVYCFFISLILEKENTVDSRYKEHWYNGIRI